MIRGIVMMNVSKQVKQKDKRNKKKWRGKNRGEGAWKMSVE